MNRNGYKNGLTNGHKPQGGAYEEVAKSAAYLLQRTEYRPLIGIICGSGLGGLSDMLEEPQAFPYSEIPGFAISTAPGHKGRLVFGRLGDKSVVCMQGRIHMYEGYPISKVAFPVRVMKMLGIQVLIATNAAGGLNPDFKVGDLMIMKDHINLPGLNGLNPLLGPNENRFGPRFPALSKTYDKELQKLAKEVGSDLNYDFVKEGVYIVQTGPCYETIAECRYFRSIGADVTAPGHKGRLVFGRLGDKSVVCMQGRIHMYEGYPISKVAFPVRVMKMLGIQVLIATNAAGGLNPDFKVGDLMIMKDHINLPGLTGLNPLLGPNENRFGPRFPALSKTYDKELQKLAKEIGSDLNYDFVKEGVYIMQTGPCFETIAECRYFRSIGADVTGMSTVPEAMVAHHMGIKVFAMSLVTNMCIIDYDSEEMATVDEVLEVGQMRSKDMATLITAMVKKVEVKDI